MVAEVGLEPHGLAFSLRRKCCGRFGGSDSPRAVIQYRLTLRVIRPTVSQPFGRVLKAVSFAKEHSRPKAAVPFWLRRWDLNPTTSGL